MSGYHHCRNNLDDSGYFVLKYRSYETLFNSSSIGIDNIHFCFKAPQIHGPLRSRLTISRYFGESGEIAPERKR